MRRLAVLDDYQRVARDYADWEALPGVETVFFHEPFGSPAETAEALRGFHVVAAMRERTAFGADVLAGLPELELLVTTGMGNAAIDLAAAAARGVRVCGTAGSGAATAELAWALLLAGMRHLPTEDASLRAGTWQRSIGRDLEGAVLGIVGLGKVGRRMARYAAAFGMEVLAWSRNLDAATAAAHGARLVGKRELFSAADAATLHLRLSERSRHTVGEEELRALGPRGLLVNNARSGLVDTEAMLRGLREGWLGGAALDVFDTEPVPAGDPVLSAPNTVLTPHLGYVSEGTYRVFYTETVESIRAWLDGDPVRVLA